MRVRVALSGVFNMGTEVKEGKSKVRRAATGTLTIGLATAMFDTKKLL